MKTGIELIADERNEQIEKHGRTIENDLQYNDDGDCILGAEALIAFAGEGNYGMFPANWDGEICTKMINKPLKERLIIAGALIAAEIDRIQHISPSVPAKD